MSSLQSSPGHCPPLSGCLAAAVLLLCEEGSTNLTLQVGPAVPLAAVLHVPEPSTQSSQASHMATQGPAFESAVEADEWEIPYEELELGPRIGIGSFGEVRPDAIVHMQAWNGNSGSVIPAVQIVQEPAGVRASALLGWVALLKGTRQFPGLSQ